MVELVDAGGGRLIVRGSLSLDTVVSLRDRGVAEIDRLADAPVIFDLTDACAVGSASILLLISWLRHCVRHDVQVSFANPSEQLMSIAQASGVHGFLPFTNI